MISWQPIIVLVAHTQSEINYGLYTVYRWSDTINVLLVGVKIV